jgi:hypothetical protein
MMLPSFFCRALQHHLEAVMGQQTLFTPMPQPREYQVRCTGIVADHGNG